jgi:type II secretory pathway pseudopilin PulG
MDRQRLGNDCGAVLLEALIALVVLATVASAAGWTASEAIHAVTRTHETEGEVRAAGRLLTAVSLWSREDLDRHLGSRRQGPWRMQIDRPHSTLYDVALTDAATGHVLLRTSLFRPQEERDR